jgi:hypothetical protein
MCVINIIDDQILLAIMGFGITALLSVGQVTKQRQLVLFIEGYANVMPTEPLILKARRGPMNQSLKLDMIEILMKNCIL